MPADDTNPPGHTVEPGPEAGIDDIQADIDKTRHELGQTVDALAAKADVKGRAQQKAADVKEHLSVPVAAMIGTTLLVVIGVIVWRRRR